MWLHSQIDEATLEKCSLYKRCFSGQVQQVVWGYQVLVVGFNIHDVFYPLYFECVRKTEEIVSAEEEKYLELESSLKEKYEKKEALLRKIKEKKPISTTDDTKKEIKILREELKPLNYSIKELKSKKKRLNQLKKHQKR